MRALPLLLLALVVPSVGAFDTTDPVGDQWTRTMHPVWLVSALHTPELQCADPATDVIAASLSQNDTTRTVRLELLDLDDATVRCRGADVSLEASRGYWLFFDRAELRFEDGQLRSAYAFPGPVEFDASVSRDGHALVWTYPTIVPGMPDCECPAIDLSGDFEMGFRTWTTTETSDSPTFSGLDISDAGWFDWRP